MVVRMIISFCDFRSFCCGIFWDFKGIKFFLDRYIGFYFYLYNNYGEIVFLGFKGCEFGLLKLGLGNEFIIC